VSVEVSDLLLTAIVIGLAGVAAAQIVRLVKNIKVRAKARSAAKLHVGPFPVQTGSGPYSISLGQIEGLAEAQGAAPRRTSPTSRQPA
jgi:hypothetical protein